MHKGNVKGSKWPPEEYTPEEVWAMIRRCGFSTRDQNYLRALIVVLYAGMARISEALSMLPHDYIMDESGGCELYYRRCKNGKYRRVYIPAEMAKFIEIYVGLRLRMDVPRDAPLFCTRTGKMQKRSHTNDRLKELAKKVGITKMMRQHDLRRSGAMRLMRANVPLAIISKALGHANVAVTQHYLTTMTEMEVLDAMKKVEWAA